jgi:hypothetical protein
MGSIVANDTMYLSQANDIAPVQYKIGISGTLGDVSWPCTLFNDIPAGGTLTVVFPDNLTLVNIDQYFQIGSNNIQFGSTTVNPDGTRPNVIINGALAANYPGLVRNGVLATTGNTGIYICNLKLTANNGATLADNAGWFAQQYFGINAPNATTNYILNCTSTTGALSGQFSGGIIGANAMGTTILGCSSEGPIGDGAGGIVGAIASLINVQRCYTSGTITGPNAGGIIGYQGNSINVTDSYSLGTIDTGGGGIFGANPGADSNCIANTCYSTGIIGSNAGGIFGNSAVTATAINCYSTGQIGGFNNAGGIFGFNYNISGSSTATNCYTSGSNTSGATPPIGGIYSGSNNDGTNNYSQSANGNSGTWITTNASIVLLTIGTGTNDTWLNIGVNQPFYLRKMGVTPYTTTVIQISPGPGLITNYTGPSILAGTTTATAIVSGYTFTLLVNPAPGQIAINASSGAITTNSALTPGTYTLLILSQINPYAVSTYELIVTGAPVPPGDVECCPTPADIALNTEVPYSLVETVRVGKTFIVERQRKPTYQFQTYADFMKYKITLANKRL